MNKFYFMHSYGNKFFLVFGVYNVNILLKNYRNFLIFSKTFDQLIYVSDFIKGCFYIGILNNDLSIALNCLNGLRCLSYCLSKIVKKNVISFIVNNNSLRFYVCNGLIKMFSLSKIKLLIPDFIQKYYNIFFIFNYKRCLLYNFLLLNYHFNLASYGNYHIIFLQSCYNYRVVIDCFLRSLLIKNINITFFNNTVPTLYTYENGVGLTSACGSATFCFFCMFSGIFNTFFIKILYSRLYCLLFKFTSGFLGYSNFIGYFNMK